MHKFVSEPETIDTELDIDIFNKDACWTRVYLRNYIFFSICHFIMNWFTKFEQDLYSRSKARAEIRFAQKTKWPPTFFFFRFVIL